MLKVTFSSKIYHHGSKTIKLDKLDIKILLTEDTVSLQNRSCIKKKKKYFGLFAIKILRYSLAVSMLKNLVKPRNCVLLKHAFF